MILSIKLLLFQSIKVIRSDHVTMVLVIMSLISACSTKLQPLDQDQIQLRISMSDCILEAGIKYFKKDYKLILYVLPMVEVDKNSTAPITLDRILMPTMSTKLVKENLVKKVNAEYWEMEYARNICILQFRGKDELYKQIDKLKDGAFLNPYIRLVLVSTTIFDDPEGFASQLFEYLWHRNAIKFILMIAKPHNVTTIGVYSWDPYNRESNCGTNFKPRYLGTCSFGKITNIEGWFNDKRPDSRTKCTVKVKYKPRAPYVVQSSPLTGIDVAILNTVSERIDLEMEYAELNESINCSLNGECDILTGGLAYLGFIDSENKFDRTKVYAEDSIVACVPSIPAVHGIRNIISMTDTQVTLLTVTLLITLASLSWYFNRRITQLALQAKAFSTFGESIYSMTRILLTSPIKLPKNSKVRYFAALLMCFSLQIDILVNSFISSELSRIDYKQKYSTIKDVFDSRLKTYFVTDNMTKIKQVNFANVPEYSIDEVYKQCLNVTVCLKYITLDSNSAIFLANSLKEYLANKNELGGEVFCIKERVLSFNVNMFLKKGFPLYHRIDSIIGRLIDTGHMVKIQRNVTAPKFKSSHEKNIGFKHLLPVFMMFMYCQIITIVTFIGEILYYNYNIVKLEELSTHILIDSAHSYH